MNLPVRDSRILGFAPGFIAAAITLAVACPASQAQRFYDHDRQWKHGSMTENGLVPDDYLISIPADTHSRSAPPFGYRVPKDQGEQAQSQPRYYQPIQMLEPDEDIDDDGVAPMVYYAASARHWTNVNHGRSKRGTSAAVDDDAKAWLNGLGGSQYGKFYVTEREKKDAAERAKPKPLALKPAWADSAGLILGGSGSTYRMNGAANSKAPHVVAHGRHKCRPYDAYNS